MVRIELLGGARRHVGRAVRLGAAVTYLDQRILALAAELEPLYVQLDLERAR